MASISIRHHVPHPNVQSDASRWLPSYAWPDYFYLGYLPGFL